MKIIKKPLYPIFNGPITHGGKCICGAVVEVEPHEIKPKTWKDYLSPISLLSLKFAHDYVECPFCKSDLLLSYTRQEETKV